LMNGEIPAVPSGGLSLVDVRDAAEAFANTLDRGLLYERHLLGGANLTLREFFDRLGRIAGVAPPRFNLPERANALGAFAWQKLGDWTKRDLAVKPQAIEMGRHFFYIDSSRAQRELGFAPRDPQETLAATVAYLRSQMPQRLKAGRVEAR
jgi:dihydroflavonol-4-reductase